MSLRASELALIALGAVWLALAAFWMPAAAFIIDGVAYHAMAEAAARNLSFFVDNSYLPDRSEALVPTLYRGTANGLTPQYPGLWGFIAAPAYALGGLRGLMLLNAAGAVAALAFTRRTALNLTGDRGVAASAALILGLAGYLVDYVGAIWPHGPAMAVVTAAMAAVTAQGGTPRGALLAGLALGLGVSIRIDVVFAAAPLALWLLGFAARPYRALAALALGMAPGLAAAAAVNWVKFADPNPFTYAGRGGAVTLAHYAALYPFAAVGALAILSIGLWPVRRLLSTPITWIALAAIGGAAALIFPPLGETAARLARGYWLLMVDFQSYPLPSHGLFRGDDGVLYAFGVIKGALFQSLPYAPLALIPLARAFSTTGRAVALALGFLLIATAPFAYSAWHGGLSNNMRYLLPATPGLAILAAMALAELKRPARRTGGGAAATLIALIASLIAALAAGWRVQPALEIFFPNLVLIVTATLTLAYIVLRPRFAAAVKGAALAGLFSAFVTGWLVDLRISREVREENAEMIALTADLPANALLVTYVTRSSALRLNQPGAETAQANFRTGEISPALAALIARAFDEGRPAFAQSAQLADAIVAAGLAEKGEGRYGAPPRVEIYPLTPTKDAP